MKKILLLLTLICIVQANEVKFIQKLDNTNYIQNLKSFEKGVKRDFYINEFLKRNITSQEALTALSLTDNLQNELFYNFAKSFKHDETLAVAQCMNMQITELIASYDDCIVAGLSLNEASKLSSLDLDVLMQKTSNKYPLFTKKLKVISSSIPFTKLIVLKKDEFYDIFLNVDKNFRIKYFNYKLPKRTFIKIFSDKKRFDIFLQKSLTNVQLKRLNYSLLNTDDKELSFNSSFLLALNAIRFDDFNKAFFYLNNAQNKVTNTQSKDKVLFWKYLITKDETILHALSNSLDLNIYSFYANELLGNEINDYAFLQRLDEFDNQLEKYDNERVALLYAIAKVKSNFDVNKISKDFEVGIMQLKNSFVENITTILNEENNADSDQFLIENSLKYANVHLDSLSNFKNNIIENFLAYEGKNELLNKIKGKDFFSNKNKFEPFMSFELISKDDKNLKDIILYKYLYQNYLSDKSKKIFKLSSIFEMLIQSDHKENE